MILLVKYDIFQIYYTCYTYLTNKLGSFSTSYISAKCWSSLDTLSKFLKNTKNIWPLQDFLNLAVSHGINVSWSTGQHQVKYKGNTELATLIKCKYILKLKDLKTHEG